MPPRKGTIEGQKPVLRVQVMAIWDATPGQLIEHCRLRHSGELRFITKNEHEAAHRLREHPDHEHMNHVGVGAQEEQPILEEPPSAEPAEPSRPAPARPAGTRARRPAR